MTKQADASVGNRVSINTEDYEKLKREVTEEVHKEVQSRLASEGASKEAQDRRSRSKLKKRLLKQRGRFTPSIKNRIRSIERNLARRADRIPGNVTAKMRQHIEQLRAEYAAGKLAERERRMAVRYRKVKSRFFTPPARSKLLHPNLINRPCQKLTHGRSHRVPHLAGQVL